MDLPHIEAQQSPTIVVKLIIQNYSCYIKSCHLVTMTLWPNALELTSRESPIHQGRFSA